MGVGNDPRYQGGPCFEPFPFPALEEGELKQRIRDLGEKLDAHRKARQAAHPELTLTGMYNVLEKLRSGEPLSDKEKKIHDDGLVTVLKQIHDELDAAVFEAYGWSDLHYAMTESSLGKQVGWGDPAEIKMIDAPLDSLEAAHREHREALEQELLTRLVALNHERAEEEKRGLIRWLRPEYQAPDEAGVPKAEQQQIELEAEKASATTALAPEKLKWPKTLSAQVAAIQKLLPAHGPDPATLATAFGRKTKKRLAEIEEILKTLGDLGRL